MADKHPYATSLPGLIQTINHLRSSFPASVDAEVLKKLGFAPLNESYVIYTLRFLDIIDDEGKRTAKAQTAFTQHEDKDFQREFQKLLKGAYKDLFGLHGEEAGTLDLDKLITFFRQSDKTSAVIGRRQANTFIALAGLAGLRDLPEQRATKRPKSTPRPKSEAKKSKPNLPETSKTDKGQPPPGSAQKRDFGLTVRIEINLPTEASQDTYDKIFKSIKTNLLNE
ncbi:MAG: DUF5343 domain-containing protein [Candidatus Aminicenantes bacterium]|nr:DUF5343 domain-containing protein [Candidatus Aminicenantes bacterium]